MLRCSVDYVAPAGKRLLLPCQELVENMTKHKTTADILPRDNEAYDEVENKNKQQITAGKCTYRSQNYIYFVVVGVSLKNWFVPCAVICSTW